MGFDKGTLLELVISTESVLKKRIENDMSVVFIFFIK